MIVGFAIDFLKAYPQAGKTLQLPADISYPIAYANEKMCWHVDDSYCAVQVFKGKYMLSYCIEIKAKQALRIPIVIHHPDIHWQYMLQGRIGVEAYDNSNPILIEKQQQQLYVEKGVFKAWVPPGRHILVGFVIAAEWLAKHEDALSLSAEDFPIALIPGLVYQSSPTAMSDAMLTDIFRLLQIPYKKGFKQETIIYAAIGNLHGAHQDEIPIDPEAGAKAKLEAIHRYIHTLIEEEQPVPLIQEIADKFYIEINHLNRIHKKHYACTISAFVNTAKLEKSIEYLYANYSILNIAFILDYNDSSAFRKAFIKKYSIPPSQYTQKYPR
ncbi:helix-turn-helix domain-containing protein [Sphingobacterium faecale]|uniref:Helix-turn-helix transcriptional regulator n=1 Tax=Sphingobacterium faecale TaxID=2803775 RepID=A0ABS1R1V7_9SPHI|nr:AraC family transcriptional regulator [Sphingobacterium faecale]MBL1408687.1 helix-turn-helix transcriptional regulator [Sphingobacterium faecale]